MGKDSAVVPSNVLVKVRIAIDCKVDNIMEIISNENK